MTIVVLNDFAYVDGGASKIALGSAKALAKRGHQVILFTAVGPIDEDLIAHEGLTIVCLGQSEIVSDPNRLQAAVRGLWNHEASSRLQGCLGQLKPSETIIHLHTWTKALSASVVRTAVQLGFKVVLTMHDFFSVCPAGSFFIHPKQQICHLRPMSAECVMTNCDSRNYGHKLWRLGRHSLQSHLGLVPSGIKHFISLSDLSETTIAPFLPEGVSIHRVPNFIDVEQSAAANVGANSAFSFVGRLSPEKGPLLLAECAEKLDLEVIFVGDGPLRGELAARLPRGSFTGWLSSAQARDAMKKSRTLVFPSLWRETQGLVVAEAAAMGIPAIVPSTSSAREWVTNEVTGLIFQGGDAADLARKIVCLRDHPEIAGELGFEAYRRYWHEPALIDRHCTLLEGVYRKMLGLI